MSGDALSTTALQHFVLGEWVDGGADGQPSFGKLPQYDWKIFLLKD